VRWIPFYIRQLILTRWMVRYPSRTTPQTAAHISGSTLPAALEIIDIDAIQDGVHDRIGKPTQVHHPRGSRGPRKCTCKGILIEFPDGKDQHTSYSFGLHRERSLPWNYQSIDDSFYIQAKSCQKWSSEAGNACQECQNLTSSTAYIGIVN
jgi:hypothetical protein